MSCIPEYLKSCFTDVDIASWLSVFSTIFLGYLTYKQSKKVQLMSHLRDLDYLFKKVDEDLSTFHNTIIIDTIDEFIDTYRNAKFDKRELYNYLTVLSYIKELNLAIKGIKKTLDICEDDFKKFVMQRSDYKFKRINRGYFENIDNLNNFLENMYEQKFVLFEQKAKLYREIYKLIGSKYG
ncbi:hypothetical protein ACWIW6_04830 [Ursidibacter sp. B-7004-1]